MKDMLVVKFGGSSISPPDLLGWVQAVEQSKRPLVLVPGGGPFASAVRKYQLQVGYADDAAHHMAILAMEQFGRAMISLGERLSPVQLSGGAVILAALAFSSLRTGAGRPVTAPRSRGRGDGSRGRSGRE